MALAGLPGMAEPLVTWLQEAERRFPGDPAIARRLGDAHLCRGDGERALRLWNGTDAETDLARTVAACLVSGRELPEVPHDQEDGVADGVLEWCGRWASESAWETLDAALSRIPQVASDLPVLRDRTVAWLDRAGQTEAADRLRKGPPAVP